MPACDLPCPHAPQCRTGHPGGQQWTGLPQLHQPHSCSLPTPEGAGGGPHIEHLRERAGWGWLLLSTADTLAAGPPDELEPSAASRLLPGLPPALPWVVGVGSTTDVLAPPSSPPPPPALASPPACLHACLVMHTRRSSPQRCCAGVTYSGVLPILSFRSARAPANSRARASFMLPSAHATCRGERPLLLCKSVCAPADSRVWATSR